MPQTHQTCYLWEGDDLILKVRVQPRASKDEIVGIQNNLLKIRLTAAPVDGEANKHLIHYLSKVFKVAKSHITLLSGQTGRVKCLRIPSPAELPSVISRFQ